jgi:RimJ/RimL family protein N-acetyltransferase
MHILQTPRLNLRQLTVDDGAFMLALLNDPAWLQYIGDRGVRTLDQARDYLRKGAIDMYARLGFGLYLVELDATHEPIGICGLIKRDTLPDVDLGFAFLPRFRGGGYAREAAAATMSYARSTLGMQRVVAIVSPENASSIALLEKLGFRFEQSLRLPPNEARVTSLFVSDVDLDASMPTSV